MRRSFRSIHFPPSPLPRATLHGCKLLKISSFNPTPPPLGLNLCSSAPPKLWTWSSIFSEKWPWHYFRTFVVSHLLAKVNCLPVNTSILKNKPLVFRSKDLKVPIQIPHPIPPHLTPPRQGSVPTPGLRRQNQMPVGCPVGKCGTFKLIDTLQDFGICCRLYHSMALWLCMHQG